MLELYQDTLMDLLSKSRKGQPTPPGPPVETKMEIKKDPKGMVSVLGATIVEVRCS